MNRSQDATRQQSDARTFTPRWRGRPATHALVVLTLVLTSLTAFGQQQSLELDALYAVADRDSLNVETLVIGNLETQTLPLLGLTIHRAKIVDTETKRVYGVTLDENGIPVDGAELRARETEARVAKYGTLDRRLFDKLELLNDPDPIRVGIWLKTGELRLPHRAPYSSETHERATSPGNPPRVDGASPIAGELIDTPETTADPAVDPDPADSLRAQAAAMLIEQMIPAQAGLLEALAELGLEPSYVSPVAPLVYVTAPKWAVVQLSHRDDVDTIYGPNENKDFNDVAKTTQKAEITDWLWSFDGSSIDVGICEDSRIEFLNPNLNAGTTRVPGDANVDDHATSTAGMVASQHSTHSGMAPSVSLFSANGTSYDDDDMAAALDWAASTQNLDVINNSWGDSSSTDLNDHDRHCDYIVRNLWSTVTVAAGNDGGGCQGGTDNVGSPGKGFNVITVGGFDDQGTETWDDDTIYNCTSFVDPSTGAEKPEVSASGANITSTTASSPWNAWVGSGTSYAAPMVAGLSASLMEVNSSWQNLPEVVKATVMASAVHNIEGSSRLSEIDGAGGIDFRAGARLAHEGTTDWRSVSTTSFPYTISRHAFAGELVRAAISWDSNPSSDYSSDPLQGDFDLRVEGPTGTYITGSFSASNPFEIVEFTAPETGFYSFEVTLWSMSSTTEYIGFAAWTSNWTLTPNAGQFHSTPDDVEDFYRYNPASFWNVVAMQPYPGSDFDLIHNTDSPWEDPADYTHELGPYVGSSNLELVLTDRNHVPFGDEFVEVRQFSGTDDYLIEHATHTADIINGQYGPYTLAPLDLVRIFDATLPAGTPKYFRVVPTSGDVDLALFLYDSDPGDESTHHPFVYNHVGMSNDGGAGEEESFNHTSTETDWHGFVVASLNSTTATAATDYMVYADTTVPTGIVTINDGATQTGSFRVDVSIVAEDYDTGIRRLRYRDSAGLWSAWVDTGGFDVGTDNPRVDLIGSGLRTVQVEVENMAGMTAIISDTIVLYSCPQPAGSLTNGDFSDTTGFPWCFHDDSTDGFVVYEGGIEAIVYGPNDSGGFQRTHISQNVSLGFGNHALSFDWSFGSGNSPGFDGAYYDVVNVATGASVVGGPITLTDTPDSGSIMQDVTGPGTFEIQLGTFSTDSCCGLGFTSFANVELVADPCLPVTGLSCNSLPAGVALSWTNGDSYDSTTILRDGVFLVVVASTVTNYFDPTATPGSHTYVLQSSCGTGGTAPVASCSVVVACDPVTSLSCGTSGSNVELSWNNGEAYSSVMIARDGSVIATLAGTATSYNDTPSAGSHTYDVIGNCGATAAAAVSCTVSVSCSGITGFTCNESGGSVQLLWNNGDAYSQIAVTRNGTSIATLLGGATSYVDTTAPAGAVTYQLQAVCAAGGALSPVSCTASVDCVPVTGLSCSISGNPSLTWTNGEPYTSITIVHNGSTIATLSGTATSYLDTAAGVGSHAYDVIGNCVGGLSAAPASCSVTIGCDPVFSLSCGESSGNVSLTWVNGDPYANVIVERDGVTIATLSGTSTSYVDAGAPAGSHTYTVIGQCSTSFTAPGVSCTVSIGCSSIVGLTCSETSGNVQLNWINDATYSQVLVRRSGVLIATLGGSATSFVDVSPPAGTLDYEVVGVCLGGIEAAAVACSIGVCATPTGLACSVTGSDVSLTWSNGASYSAVSVYRNGVLLATLPGSTTAYVDSALGEGSYMYAVEGDCGTATSGSTTCMASVVAVTGGFIRGDCNTDGASQISDVVYGLAFLFSGGPASTCADACDVNDDGVFQISDMVFQLGGLFSGGALPPTPYPSCGADPTPDSLGCDSNPGCP